MAHGGGSKFFVDEKLATILNEQPKPMFLGAIILDSVMNYNVTEGSQILPNGFDKVKSFCCFQNKLKFQKLFAC